MKSLLMLLISINTIFTQTIQVKENIRLSPNGEIIGQLERGTGVKILKEQGNWAKVSIEGYIWLPSISDVGNKSKQYPSSETIIKTAISKTYSSSDSYHIKLRRELKNPNYSKYSKENFIIWAYMQSIWDEYETLHGVSGAENKVFESAATKFGKSKSQVIAIFHKVDNKVF